MMVRKGVIVAALCGVLLGACGNDLSQNAMRSADDTVTAASREYIDCLRNAARKLDDGRANPDALAPQVAAQCATQYATLKEALGQNLAGASQQSFYADMDSKQLSVVSDIVRRERPVQSVTALQ